MSHYTAAVCEKGHCLTAMLRPGVLPDKFCKKCGKRVLTKCPSCDAKIRGAPFGAISAPGYSAPKYCPQCGAPFPWTLGQLELTKLSIDQHAEESGVSRDDAAALKSFVESASRGESTQEQVEHAKGLIKKFGPAGSVIWDQVKDLAARTVAAMLKP